LQDADPMVKPTTNIYAEKGTMDVNVIFTEKDDGTIEIQLAYSQKPEAPAEATDTLPQSQ